MDNNKSQSTSNTRWIAVIVGGLLGVVFILLVLSNALPSWSTVTIARETLTVGLWRGCRTFIWRHNFDECFATRLTCSGGFNPFLGQCLKLIMTRTFIIMACIFSGFGAILLVVIGIGGKGNPRLIIVGKVLVIISLICSIIGFSVGISWVLYDGRTLATAAILAIIATGLNIVSAILVLFIRKQQIQSNFSIVHLH